MKIIRLLVVVAVVVAAIFFVNRSMIEKDAELRVQRVLDGMVAGGTGAGGDIQDAVCAWWDGSKIISDTTTLAAAMDSFEQWRKAKGLYRSLSAAEVTTIEVMPDTKPAEVKVTIRVEGTAYAIKVVDREPMTWLY